MNNRASLLVGGLFVCASGAWGQSNSEGWHVGLDLLKSVPLVFQHGYVLEPSVVYRTKSQWFLEGSVGICDVTKDSVYYNAQYENRGSFVKLGAGKKIVGGLTVNANFVYTDFKETAIARFKGPYYGDLETTTVQHNQLFAVELVPNYWLPLSNRFTLNFQIRVNMMLNSPDESKFPVYYAPGLGYMQDKDNARTGARMSGGFSVRLLYHLSQPTQTN